MLWELLHSVALSLLIEHHLHYDDIVIHLEIEAIPIECPQLHDHLIHIVE